jgi:hypothetical protein
MIIYRFRPDMVYDCEIEVPDGTKAIPKYHTFQAPPVKEGHYAMMRGGWVLIEGDKPVYPPPPPPFDPAAELESFNSQQKKAREEAYKEESDPIFFKAQRGDSTMEEWIALVEEIKQRFPYKTLEDFT